MMRYPEYAGMSYEQASRKADEVLMVEGWYRGRDRLNVLASIMDHGVDAGEERAAEAQEAPDGLDGSYDVAETIKALRRAGIEPSAVTVTYQEGEVSITKTVVLA